MKLGSAPTIRPCPRYGSNKLHKIVTELHAHKDSGGVIGSLHITHRRWDLPTLLRHDVHGSVYLKPGTTFSGRLTAGGDARARLVRPLTSRVNMCATKLYV